MNNILLHIFEFVVAFVLSYLYQKLFVVNKYKKNLKKDKKEKTPPELTLFLNLTKIKEKNIDTVKTLNHVIIANSIDVGIIIVIISFVDGIILKVLLALVLIVALLIASYKLLAAVLYKSKENKKNV